MLNIAIISEYNPFHNGHKYQIQKIREIHGENTNIIVIMSGNVVQRGDFSCIPKYERAKMAVLGGVNLVFELPICYALSSAENFAFGAVYALDKLNLIDYLYFGSECGNIDMLCEISDILISKDFSIKEQMKTGVSYPKALENELYLQNKEFSNIIKNPNNTLGIEYIKAIKKLNSKIIPKTILRKNVGHNDLNSVDDFASASYIRDNFYKDIEKLIPKESYDVLLENFDKISLDKVENSVFSFLKRKNIDYFREIYDVSEGLEYKIVSALKISTTLLELFNNIKSKRYTHARIRRIILNAYLEITKENLSILPTGLKVLALDRKGREILKTLKATSDIEISVKHKDYNSYDKEILERVYDLYALAFNDMSKRLSSYEQKSSPYYLDK